LVFEPLRTDADFIDPECVSVVAKAGRKRKPSRSRRA
jgi:hypothetical protein